MVLAPSSSTDGDVPDLPSGALLIGDGRVSASSGGSGEHVNPSTGRVQAQFELAGEAEIDDAVAAARSASDAWRRWPAQQRRQVLWRIAELLDEHAPELATIRTLETGAVRRAGKRPSMPADWFQYYAGWTDKLQGATLPVYPGTALDYTVPEPFGTVAVLIPWNAPLSSAGMKVAPALAAGNCVVLKPSDLAPFAALRLGELALEAGLPPGVLNVVPGGPAAGAALVSHAGVDKITFTGGAATARRILQAAATNLTPVILELGGKSANIVFADGDLAVAASTAVQVGVVNLSGQGCVLPTRLLVQDEVYDEVRQLVVDAVAKVVVGDPFDPATHMGPVISEAACDRILTAVAAAADAGDGKLLSGGTRSGGSLADGFFVQPTVFGDVDPQSDLAQHELFGPVLSMIRFRTEEEALDIANGTEYGLGGVVFTSDVTRAHRVAAALQAGSIGVNGFFPMAPAAPFGGMKSSGYGREGGLEGLLEFVRTKNVHVALG